MTISLPDLRRLRYFHGQMLGAHDFRREQEYFIERLKLRNRCLHGWGVVCGLHVTSVDKTDAYHGKSPSPVIRLQPGVAIDCLGNEIVVVHTEPIELWRRLSPADRQTFRDGDDLYLSVAYRQRPVDKAKAVFSDGCGGGPDCDYGSWQDGFEVLVTCQPPDTDGCADPCCECCPDARVLLARITDVRLDQAVGVGAVQMQVRRPLTRYRLTTITGINWVHGGVYRRDEAFALLGHDDPNGGLAVRFSAGVHTGSLLDGVIEVQVIEGGGGRNSDTWYIAGQLVKPNTEFTDWVRYRQRTDETLQRGDRVIITVRTPFILDRCCRPVDGGHVGGRVPLLAGQSHPAVQHAFCQTPPSGIGPWTSGTGTGAGNFESWFFIEEKK
jgi:hypothetical protein